MPALAPPLDRPLAPPLAPPLDRPLRLAFLGDANSIHVHRWAGWFADHGHTVSLLVPAGFEVRPGLPRTLSVERFRPYYQGRFRPYGYVAERRSLREVVARLRPDVVHAHYLTEYGWHAWMSGFHPYAITVWGSDVTISLRRSRRTALYGRVSLRGADLVTGDSASLVEDVIAAGARPDRTHLIQFGVDTGLFSPGPDPAELRARLGLQGRRVLFSPRLIRPLYRHTVAVEALASLPDDFVLLMGRYQVDEAELAAVLGRAEALGLSDRIHVVPSIDHGEMPDFYRLAAAVLTLPMSDATPVTLLEALACERPVVATDLPSVREWLAELDGGSLVPIDDAQATADGILRIAARSLEDQRQIGRRGRAIVQERASQDANMTAVEVMYNGLRSRRP